MQGREREWGEVGWASWKGEGRRRSLSTTTGWLLQGGGLSRGLVSVCLRGRGLETETEERRELSWNSGAICHIRMALELPGGPPS